ncbi:fungal-specific transcription factor domain-containing protein [Aspergillus coremiiformis]|uniref:Fungal-specific transcription factor domain-containing protein n=1 Tax=Aspergillus coremiiformis TaxID=138285 RepID=A0A5N6YWC3_9EURO|nr:fungal-specific transcription factor domain-containing protein [Aspergillus coremiiformis]
MLSRRSAVQKSNGARRRKASLCCDPCRERKSRCDGQKPVCGSCTQRSNSADRCVYRRSSCRLMENDEYLQVLYRHIRELEDVCQEAGIPVPTFDPDESSMESDEEEHPSLSLDTESDSHAALPNHENFRAFPPPVKPETFPSLLTNPQDCDINFLGAATPIGENKEFLKQPSGAFGSPSPACLMHLLAQGPVPQDIPYGPARSNLDAFLLPPRELADHLLGCFWDRIYCLYPFFDRPSVQDAYECLWVSCNKQGKEPSTLNIGLGSKSDSGPRSPVFLCALNLMFALGCHFADISVPDRNTIAHTFFLRAEQHIGLDLLVIRTVGAVQTLLIASLYLQSIPDPHKSWDLIGVACRIAQGLGLHENQPSNFKDPLELEIQRRTWHGCVMIDTFGSMAYGRPSITFSLPTIPLPGSVDLTPTDTKGPYLTAFYAANIELSNILGSILSDVYKRRCDRSSATTNSSAVQQSGLDAMVRLEEKLSNYESKLPSVLSWSRPFNPPTDLLRLLTLRRQRNVLYARFLYMRILLYRPAFTQLSSEMLAQEDSEIDQYDSTHKTPYSSMLSECAISCTKAAIDLVSIIYDSYQTSTTDAWWYNSFYTTTAGMVLIMSYTCRLALTDAENTAVNESWRKCEQILQYMIPYNFSTRNTLLFLRAARGRILSYLDDEGETCTSHMGPDSSQVNGMVNPFVEDPDNHMFNGPSWLGSAVAMVGLGFLCPTDFKWFQEWLAEELP